jgi:predicted nucleic acid-binding protein
MYLLDTNVVSEFRQDDPAPGVIRFLAEVAPEQTYLSVVTLMELQRGVSMLPPGKRRSEIEDWIDRTLVPR